MHVLRSTYLPAYAALIRPPYTSDPFPHGLSGLSATPSYQSSESATASLLPTQCMQRETRVLDLFIALKVREDAWKLLDEHLDLEMLHSISSTVALDDVADAAKELLAGTRHGRTIVEI